MPRVPTPLVVLAAAAVLTPLVGLAPAAVLAPGASAARGGSAAQAQAPVSTYPVPGMSTATTRTQLSFRGAPRAAIGTIVVTGSRSGRHTGTLRAHSDGNGASFIPSRPFSPGERVAVRTRLSIQGARGGDYSFEIGRRAPLAPTRPAESPLVGRGDVQRFATRRELVPPAVTITTRRDGRAPGLVFLAPKKGRGHDGPMIIDDAGQIVWFKPMTGRELANDFRVQEFRGEPVLTWWQGRASGGNGRGEGVIYDRTYRGLKRVRMANGLRADLHEFTITPHGSALLIAYDAVRRAEGIVLQAVVQELDIETGLVLFEWHSIGNVALAESYRPQGSPRQAWDYLHVNSVALDARGDFIISARQTRAVYRISRATGRVVWRLGGKRSDFKLGPGASIAYQHDARPQPDGSLTIFDNGSSPPVRKHSRAITLALDERGRTATLRQALVHPDGLLSATQGGAQRLLNGGMFVGWGSHPWFTEYDAAGRVVFNGRLAPGNDNYRAYRFEWQGAPAAPPKAVASRSGGRVTARVSWNGATEVARWELLAGSSEQALEPLAAVAKDGFETALGARTNARFVAVRALDAAGAELGRSAVLRVR